MQASHIARPTLLLSILAVLQFALFLGYFPFSIIVTPYGDVLDWLNEFYNLPDHNLWPYLWAPHNGHRILFTKLLMVGDVTLFGGLGYPIAWVCMFALLIAAAITLFAVWRSVEHRDARRWATAVTALLLFPTSSYASFAYPVNSQHLLVCFFVFMTCVLFARAGVMREQMLERNVYFLLALMAAVCASLTSLNGLMSWPLLVWMVWALRLGRNFVFASAALGVLAMMGFSYHYPLASEAAASISGLGNIAHIVKYLIEYHGMPWVEIGPLYWPAMGLGLAVFLLSIIFSVKGVLATRAQPPIAVVAVAMLMFSLATAVMIAIGRHQMDLLPAHRYSMFLLITFVSLFVLNIPRFELWMSSRQGRSMVMSATLVMALGYLGQQVVVGQFAIQRAQAFAQYEKEIMAGGRDPKATTALYFPSVEILEERYRMLEKQRIYMFRPQ